MRTVRGSGDRRHAGWCEDEQVAVLHLTGHDSIDLLQRLSANDIGGLRVGQTVHTPLLTEKGRIIDILTIHHEGERLLVLCSAQRAELVEQWIEKFTITEDVQVQRVTHSFTVIWVDVSALDSSAIDQDAQAGGPVLVLPHFASDSIRRMVVGSGARIPLDQAMRVSPSERDMESIMLGVPGAPGELNERHTPYDVNLQHLISFTKGCYIGQEVIARLDTYAKTHKRMIGLAAGEPLAVTPPVVITRDGKRVGTLTSIARQSLAGVWPALAVVEAQAVRDGDIVDIQPEMHLKAHSLPMSF